MLVVLGAAVALAAEDGVVVRTIFPVGTGAGTAKVNGLIDLTGAVVGNVGAGEDTLYTYTIQANTLSTTGRGLHFRANGNVANNANTKNLKWYFGATTSNNFITANTNSQWKIEIWVYRIGSSQQRVVTEVWETTGTTITEYQQITNSPTETDTGAIVLKVTCEAVADNDCDLYTTILETL